jgi:hypothetical protein
MRHAAESQPALEPASLLLNAPDGNRTRICGLEGRYSSNPAATASRNREAVTTAPSRRFAMPQNQGLRIVPG